MTEKLEATVDDGIFSKNWIIYSRKFDMSVSDFSYKQVARALKKTHKQ